MIVKTSRNEEVTFVHSSLSRVIAVEYLEDVGRDVVIGEVDVALDLNDGMPRAVHDDTGDEVVTLEESGECVLTEWMTPRSMMLEGAW